MSKGDINQRFVTALSEVEKTHKDLNKGAIAKKLGISPQVFTEIRGNRMNVSPEHLQKLFDSFGVEYDYIFKGKGPVFSANTPVESPGSLVEEASSMQITPTAKGVQGGSIGGSTGGSAGKRPQIPSNIEPLFIASEDLKAVPIVDIAVATGAGYLNPDTMEVKGYISVPKNLLGRGFHVAVKNRGESMAPTLQDSSYLIIRLLDKAEWQDMGDEEIYVVSDREATAWVKRLKVRWERGFIVLMSDNPDKATHPNFNLSDGELNNIWHLDCAFSFRFPNIHSQYYSRLKQLEDSVEEVRAVLKLDERNKVHELKA